MIRRYSPIILPAALTALVACLDFVWNRFVGLNWMPRLWELCVFPGWFLISAECAHRLRKPIAAEILSFSALWLLYSVFADRLSYLVETIGFAEQDGFLERLDSALGFDWFTWAKFTHAFAALPIAYASFYYQPFLSVAALALWAPGRNRKMFIAMVIASLATIAVGTFFPAIGPAPRYGASVPWDHIIPALRSRSHAPLPYVGVISFPSFHTAIAIIFTLAHRGLWTFPVFAALNILMLISIPYQGGHYLVDVLAGAAIGLSAWRIAPQNKGFKNSSVAPWRLSFRIRDH